VPTEVSSTAIVPANGDGEYQIQIKEFDAAGKSTSFMVPIPTDINSQQASVMIRTAILKKTTWQAHAVPVILAAVMYSDRMGLDIMAGDVYMTPDGRMSTTAGAKIRHAMSTNRIKGYDVEIVPGAPITLKYTTKKGEESWTGPNLSAKVTIFVKGWSKPVTYQATLEEWFMGTNPNWRTRPAYMLRKNALSKAMEEVAPLGVEGDEAPPIEGGK
jgi:hypothetical protein